MAKETDKGSGEVTHTRMTAGESKMEDNPFINLPLQRKKLNVLSCSSYVTTGGHLVAFWKQTHNVMQGWDFTIKVFYWTRWTVRSLTKCFQRLYQLQLKLPTFLQIFQHFGNFIMPTLWHIFPIDGLYVITHADSFGLVHNAAFFDSLFWKKKPPPELETFL